MNRVKLYKYYINNIEKPLVMEAESREMADQMLVSLNNKLGGNLSIKNITDVRIETLVVGESSKIKGGKKHIWVGKEYSNDGWLEKNKYLEIVINNKKQQKNG
jgi:hypothetical protein